ncbi:MAG: insulinase family protein [Deltaproteobacteria bacterium]|nr:insulinase family protein [Deltaproteobacteria bacterium]
MLTSHLAAALLLAAPPPALEIPFERFRLPNGLHVILSVDHSAPIVGVDVRYDVGSRDEPPGRTGFAHLFEHLMFQGTVHLPKGEADRLIEAAGGSSNGATSEDGTEYWQQVPSSALEQALYIEAERMGFTLQVLDQAKLDNQRDVVKNERRETMEMQPYGAAWPALRAALWNPEFPYHWLPIGSHQDLTAATLDDVKDWFRRGYGPGNASLAIAGDFDPREARRLVERWFGAIPAGGPIARTRQVPRPLSAIVRVEVQDAVQLPRLYLAWQSPAEYQPDDAPLDLAADVLASGKSSRLVRRLVMEEKRAQSVWVAQSALALAGTFLVVATPKPGVAIEALQAAVDEEIARLAREGPTEEELLRAKNRIESGAVFALEPVGGFSGRAAVLNRYHFETGDPGYLARDLARYRDATAADVRAAVGRWLSRPRVELTVVPKGAAAAAGVGR